MVPDLRYGDGNALSESAAILRHFASQYGDASFWSNETPLWTDVHQCAKW